MKIWIISIISLVLYSFILPEISLAYDDNLSSEDITALRANAQKGDPEAQFNLAEAYLKGDGVRQSEREAARWYYKSAMQGYVEAQVAMGFAYRGGGGLPMDKVLSYMWFDLAAKNGDDRAFSLRNDVAWSMTESEIDEARRKSREWRPEFSRIHTTNSD